MTPLRRTLLVVTLLAALGAAALLWMAHEIRKATAPREPAAETR